MSAFKHELLASPNPAEAGRRVFGRYRVVRVIGAGGMGRVYEAQHVELGSRVALKVMAPALAADEFAASRFVREARAAAQIRHRHVVQVFDLGRESELPFIVMELVEGSNLAALIAARGALPVQAALAVCLPVLSAVATAHDAGIVHRDLKPANVMLAERVPLGIHPMVLDFGISKASWDDDAEAPPTRSESLLGTIHYMAPELTRGAKFASPATDQYALAAMLYECVTGTRPFSGQSSYDLMHAIVTAPLVPARQRCPDISPELDAVLSRGLHKDPGSRYPSVRAFGSALLSFADRPTWATWQGEFLGLAESAAELWTRAGDTMSDAKRAQASSERARVRRWPLALLGGYAACATLLLMKRPDAHIPAQALAATSTAPPPPPPSALATEPLAPATEPPAPATEPPAPATEPPAPATRTAHHASLAARPRVPPATIPRPERSLAPGVAPATAPREYAFPAPSSAKSSGLPPRPAGFGSNAAPILD